MPSKITKPHRTVDIVHSSTCWFWKGLPGIAVFGPTSARRKPGQDRCHTDGLRGGGFNGPLCRSPRQNMGSIGETGDLQTAHVLQSPEVCYPGRDLLDSESSNSFSDSQLDSIQPAFAVKLLQTFDVDPDGVYAVRLDGGILFCPHRCYQDAVRFVFRLVLFLT